MYIIFRQAHEIWEEVTFFEAYIQSLPFDAWWEILHIAGKIPNEMDSESISGRKYRNSLSQRTKRVERKSYDKLYCLFTVSSFLYFWEFLHRLQNVVTEAWN
jgi:hypothetical protein